MKIMIIGSMAFVRNMVLLEKKLKELGHIVKMPYGTEPHMKDPSFVDSLEKNLEYCIQNNVMKENFDKVAKSNSVLVVNKKRNGINGYIGVSALMEMAIARYLGKKIFLLHSVSNYKAHRWAHEVAIIQPVVIHGDLGKIK